MAPASSSPHPHQSTPSPARTPSIQQKPQSQPQAQVAQAQPRPQPRSQPPPLHLEIRSAVQLFTAHAHKIYYSGPLVRRIERRTADEVWFEVWAQLGGTTLSIWDMAKIEEASKQGKEVHPTYVNTTDAFVQVIGAVTIPERYAHVFSISNTAGSNLLFSCPDLFTLKSWVSALRLSSWERSRLDEIYTAHLLRITHKLPDIPSTLVRGRLEGWVRVRIAGQTDWKRMWMVISAGAESATHADRLGPTEASVGVGVVPVPTPAPTASLPRKKRFPSLFARDSGVPVLQSRPLVSMYASHRPNDRKRALLSMRDVTQAFAVYPERPELISRSTLIKMEGTFGEGEMSAAMRDREGWLLVMPELGGLDHGHMEDMLQWVIAIHDAFEMYGRPEMWTWDPRDPMSLMFAYPVGPNKDLLFLARELAETLDPLDDSTASIRSCLIGILYDRMRGHEVVQPPRLLASDRPPTLPPIQLPPLSFSDTTPFDDDEPLSLVRRQIDVEEPAAQSSHVGLIAPPHEGPVLDHAIASSSGSPPPPPPPQSAPEVELARSPSLWSSVVDARRSFDTQGNSRGFTAPSPVDSTISSAAVFNKSQAEDHAALSHSTVSSGEALRPLSVVASPTTTPAPSPSSYAASSPPVSVSSPDPSMELGPPLVTVPKRSMSVLTSAHQILNQDEELSLDVTNRASSLTLPHSIMNAKQPTLKSPYSPRGTIRSLDGRYLVDRAPSISTAMAVRVENDINNNNLHNEAGASTYTDDLDHHVPTKIDEQSDNLDKSSSQLLLSKQSTVISPGLASNDLSHEGQPAHSYNPVDSINVMPSKQDVELEVLKVRTEAFGSSHPETVQAMSDLAATFKCSGKLKEAENLELEVFKFRTESFGSHHPDTIQAMFNLVETFWQSGQIAKAEKLEEEILEVRVQAFGRNHPDTIQAMADVATIFWQSGKIVEAERLDQEVLELRNKAFEKTHKATLQAMSNLAATFRKNGELKKAEVLQQEVLRIHKEAFGSSHPDTIQAMLNLTITYWQGGKLEDAKELNQEVLEIEMKKEVSEKSHLNTIQVMSNLAATYWQGGNLEEAEKLEQKVLQMRKGEFESINIPAITIECN